MNELTLKLKHTTVEVSTTYQNELQLLLTLDVENIKSILESIYEIINTEDFIATLDQDQIDEIVEYNKESNENN